MMISFQILHEWGFHFSTHPIAELHLFYFDLVHRLFSSPPPKRIKHPSTSSLLSIPLAKKRSDVFSVPSTPLLSTSSTTAASIGTHSSAFTSTSRQQAAYAHLCRDLCGGMIGFWLAQPEDLLIALEEVGLLEAVFIRETVRCQNTMSQWNTKWVLLEL